jgi:addiction module HigA family antidote
MLPEKRIPTHPGEVLLMEFLTPMGLTQVEFAKHLKIPIQRLNEITRGKRGVSPETAWLFAQALGTSPEFWLNLQTAHDLAKAHPSKTVATVAVLDKHRKARESRTIDRITGEERSGFRSNKSASRKGRS